MKNVIRKFAVALIILLSIIIVMDYFTYASAASILHEVQKRGTLRFGWANWWPYVYRDAKTNQLTGVIMDLAQEMADALNVKLEWVEDSWGTFAAGIQGNKFDIWTLVAITYPRAMAVGFSDPITVHGLSLLVVKEKEPGLKSWQELDKKGKKISVTIGTNSELYLTRVIKEAEIIRMRTGPEAVTGLKLGKWNAYASTIDSLRTLAKNNPDTYVVPGEFARSPAALAMRQDDQIWINWVNLFIKDMKMTGTISRLLEKQGLDASFMAP